MEDKKLKAHLFVCTNTKEKGQSCGPKGGGQLRATLKDYCAQQHPEWKNEVRINAAGCLGRCEEGIAAVLYPQQKWFTGLTYENTSSEQPHATVTMLLKSIQSS